MKTNRFLPVLVLSSVFLCGMVQFIVSLVMEVNEALIPGVMSMTNAGIMS